MNLFFIILAIVLIVLLIVLILTSYVKAPPDTAFIISGFRKNPKILIGRAGFRIPFLERLDKLSLKQVTVDIKTEGYIPSLDFINIMVDAVAKVRVGTEPELLERAMRNFLNKSSDSIVEDLKDSLQGNMREVIGSMSLKDISNNREAFGNQIQQKASVDMKNLGIEIISCNIQNVEDENGLIQDMGMDNTAKIRKDAAIAKAEADRDVDIKKAEADKEANDARVKADLEIAQKQNELEIKKSELKKIADKKAAEADAAFEIEKQEQRKIIETTSTDADIAKREREVQLREREVEVEERSLEASIKKKAEAEKFKEQQEADARLYIKNKEAEASKYETECKAQAKKVEAEAEKYAQEQEAEAIRIKGKAEADAIRDKGIAEAEAIEKKAQAMEKYGKAAILEMALKVYPEMAKSIAEPIAAIDKVTVIGGDSKGVSDMAGNVPIVFSKVMETMKEATGIDIAELVKADTFEGKTTKNINVTGIDNKEDSKPQRNNSTKTKVTNHNPEIVDK